MTTTSPTTSVLDEAITWPGIETQPTPRGATAIVLDGHELGHVHPDRQAAVRDMLLFWSSASRCYVVITISKVSGERCEGTVRPRDVTAHPTLEAIRYHREVSVLGRHPRGRVDAPRPCAESGGR